MIAGSLATLRARATVWRPARRRSGRGRPSGHSIAGGRRSPRRRAKGMSQLARDTGLGRESLYKALSGEGNPSFATILKVAHALGIKLHAAPINP